MASQQQRAIDFVATFDGAISTSEVATALTFNPASTAVYLSRGVQAGQIIRVSDGNFAHVDFALPTVVEEVIGEEGEPELEAVDRFEGVIATEGTPTGDGRMLERGSVVWEGMLPVPLIWDALEGDHTGRVVGMVTEVERVGDDLIGRGTLSSSESVEVQEAVMRVKELFAEGAVGVSIALDDDVHELRVKRELVAEAEAMEDEMAAVGDPSEPKAAEDEEDDEDEPDEEEPKDEVLGAAGDRVVVMQYSADDALDVTTSGRLRHVAIVDTPAIPNAKLAIAASGALITEKWAGFANYFDDPKFTDPTSDTRLRYDPATGQWSCPPTVIGDKVFGHVAAWGYCLRGRPDRCVTPPDGDLETYMRAYAPAAGGKRTGVICVGGGHAKTGVGPGEATRFYDNTGRAVADVRVGRDQYGIWFAGMIRPGASDEDIYTFSSSDVSGHWETDINGRFRLCGLPAVNVGGFPKGLYTYSEVMQGLAASATLDEDCGCDEVTLSDVMRELTLLKKAVTPLYAAHLATLDDD